MIRLAIDTGSWVTKIYMIGQGVVLSEATCVAVEYDENCSRCKAYGDRARAIAGKSAKNTEIVNPVKEGDIDCPDLLVKLFYYFFDKIEIKPSKIKHCDVLFVLPCGYTKTLQDKYTHLAEELGIGRVSFTSMPFAAILGHNIRLTEALPVFCVDIGHAVTNIAALSLDGIISGFTINLGGGNIDVHLMSYVAENYGMRIGALTAEKLKISIGNLLKNDETPTAIDGISTKDGSPVTLCFKASQIQDVVRLYTDKIIEYIALVINRLPAEVSGEIANDGIYLSGGAAKCIGIKEYIEEKLGIAVHLSVEPALSPVIGAGTILSSGKLSQRLTSTEL